MPVSHQRSPRLPQNSGPTAQLRVLPAGNETRHADHDALHAPGRHDGCSCEPEDGGSSDLSEAGLGGEEEGESEGNADGSVEGLEERGEGVVCAEGGLMEEGLMDEDIGSPTSTPTSTTATTPAPTPVDTANTSLAPSPRLGPSDKNPYSSTGDESPNRAAPSSIPSSPRLAPEDKPHRSSSIGSASTATGSISLAPSLRLDLADESNCSSIGDDSTSIDLPPHFEDLSFPSANNTVHPLDPETEPFSSHLTTSPSPSPGPTAHDLYLLHCGTYNPHSPPPPHLTIPPLTRNDRIIYYPTASDKGAPDNGVRYYTIDRNGNRKPCWLRDAVEDLYDVVAVKMGWREREGWEAERRQEWRGRRAEMRRGKT